MTTPDEPRYQAFCQDCDWWGAVLKSEEAATRESDEHEKGCLQKVDPLAGPASQKVGPPPSAVGAPSEQHASLIPGFSPPRFDFIYQPGDRALHGGQLVTIVPAPLGREAEGRIWLRFEGFSLRHSTDGRFLQPAMDRTCPDCA